MQRASIDASNAEAGAGQTRIEGGESFDDVRGRFLRLLDTLRAQPPGGPVLLLGHAGTSIGMLSQMLSNVSVEFARQRSIRHAETVIAEMRANRLIGLARGSVRLPLAPRHHR